MEFTIARWEEECTIGREVCSTHTQTHTYIHTYTDKYV